MRGLAALGLCTAMLLCAPAMALADMTVTNFTVDPSTKAAGAHPDVTITEQFSYSDSMDSVKKTVLHFPPGLLGNPQATAKCAEAAFEADACPANTRVGTVSVGTSLPGPPSPGDIYNLVPDSAHPAVLGIVVRPPMPADKIFLKSPITLRTSTDFGIESPVDNQPNTVKVAGIPTAIQITSTTLTLFGHPAGAPAAFMSNPTSCKPATTHFDAISHESPGQTATASSSFTPTDCDKLPFAPKVSAVMGAAGATARNSRVPFQATISQAVGESAQLSATVTLPASLTSSTNAVATLCTVDQLAAAACPDGARIGTATILSPLLPTAVQGPVFFVAHPPQLPGVGVEFGGTLPFVLSGTAGLVGGRLQNAFPGLPDVPLTSFRLAIDGGPHGLLTATRNICTGPAPMVNGELVGQNGAHVNVSAPVTVEGCGPVVSKPRAKASARGLRGRHPLLTVTVRKGSSKLRSVSVTLPKDIRAGRNKRGLSATGASFRLSKKKIRLSRKGKLTLKLPGGGANRVTAKLRKGAIHSSKRLKRKLRRHRTVKLRLTVRTVDTAGHRATLHVKFTGRR